MSASENATLDLTSPGPPWIALRISRVQVIFLAALAAALLSKIGAAWPGFAPDGYFFSFRNAQNLQGIAQGRILTDALIAFVNALGVTLTSVQLPALLAASVALSALIAVVLNSLVKRDEPLLPAVCAAAFAASHPYFSSYFLFRMALIGHAIFLTLTCVAYVIFVKSSMATRSKAAACTVLLVLAANINQLGLILFFLGAFAWTSQTSLALARSGSTWRTTLQPFYELAVTLIATAVVYFLLGAIVRHAMHIVPTVAYSPELGHGILHILANEVSLGLGIVWSADPLLPGWLKWALLIFLAILFIRALIYRPASAALALIFFVLGILVTVAPMAVSWNRHVARIFSPTGLVFSITFLFLIEGLGRLGQRFYATSILVFVALFSMLSATMFYQNYQLTQWDQRRAAAIYYAATERGLLIPGRKLRLVAQWPLYAQELSMNGNGVNESVYWQHWSYPGLFRTAVGAIVAADSGDPKVCENKPTWPKTGSMFLYSAKDVYVCL